MLPFFFRRRLFASPLLLACCLLLAAPLASLADDELITMNMRDADIPAVIQWMAEQTGKKMVIDPRVQGRITVLSKAPMTTNQAYQVFLAMMDVYGFAVSESQGIVRIYPASMAKISPSELVDSLSQTDGEQIAYVFQAQRVSATELARLLQPLLPASGAISAFPSSNSLLLIDDSSNVRRLVAIAERLDNGTDLAFETVALQYAQAEQMAALIESLLSDDEQKAFAVAADERSNALLLSGDPTIRRKVTQLVEQLDKPLQAGSSSRVVYLNYMDADEILPILQGVTEADREAEKDIASNQKVTLAASASANAIILTGAPARLDSLQQVIEQIDIRRAQVLVEAVIVEVAQDYSQQLGVEWSTDLSGDGVKAVSNFGLSNALTGFISEGLSLGYYRDGSLRALLQALAVDTRANILSTPSIVTLDNQQAEVLVGRNIPIRTSEQTSAASPTDNPFTTIAREDIGLTLKITPQINRNNEVTLDVLQEIETISDSVDVTDDIVTDKRSIKTKVLVADSTILVLGGLIADEKTTTERKVPFFGDIPLIGGLFRSTEDSTSKRNLMVFIHPKVLDSEQLAESVTEERYRKMQTLQQRFHDKELELGSEQLEDFKLYKPSQNQ